MKKESFYMDAPDGEKIFIQQWIPDGSARAFVQIAHGMGEYGDRYDRFANELVNLGFGVIANDHRGHGKTVKDSNSLGFFAAKNGFNLVVEDMARLSIWIKQSHSGAPLFLFGHSLGSALSQSYISRFGNLLNGVILSGSVRDIGLTGSIMILKAKKDIKKWGSRAPNHWISNKVNTSLNKSVKRSRTKFDWLSTVDEIVDEYVADPLCGFEMSSQFWIDFFSGLKAIERKNVTKRIPKHLPVFVFAGSQDPVNRFGKNSKRIFKQYRNLGLADTTFKIYPGGRHEMLNEVNQKEVITDIAEWMTRRIE